MRREIVAQVKAATGRDLQIAGPMSVTFYPSAGVSAGDVTLSAPSGMGGDPLLTADSIDVGVALLPLLRQEIVVDRLVLHQPVFALRVDREGAAAGTRRRSRRRAVCAWRRPTPARAVRGSISRPAPLAGGAEPGAERRRETGGVALADVRILDGTLRYSDERTGAGYEIAAIGAEMQIPSIAAPARRQGQLRVVEGEDRLRRQAHLAAGRRSRIARQARAPVGGPAGQALLRRRRDAQGRPERAKAASPAMRPRCASLVGWLGTELRARAGARRRHRRRKRARRRERGPPRRRQADARRRHGDGHDRRDVGRRPAACQRQPRRLGTEPRQFRRRECPALVRRDARRAAGGPAPEATRNSRARIDRGSAREPQQPRAGPQVKGLRQARRLEHRALRSDGRSAASMPTPSWHWPRAPIAISSSMDRRSPWRSRTTCSRRPSTTCSSTRVAARATSRSTGSAPSPWSASTSTLSGIAVGPLLKDTADIDWLAGKANVKLALTGQGSSEAAIVQSLKGKADVSVKDGALVGYDLGGAMQVARGRQGARPRRLAVGQDRVQGADGNLPHRRRRRQERRPETHGPLLRATGAGTVQLPERSLDYIVRPKIVASSDAEAGKENAAGIEVPVHVTGAWSNPEFAPDIGDAINNPGTVEAVKELGKKFKGKKAGEVLEDLFGKNEDGEPSKAERLLQKFLGPQRVTPRIVSRCGERTLSPLTNLARACRRARAAAQTNFFAPRGQFFLA